MKRSGKIRYTALGMAMGMAVTGGAMVYADDIYQTVSAYLTDDVTIEYNGEDQTLPSGYNILNYQGRTYVPMRYVSELLGADVDWDDSSRKVIITGTEAEAEENASADSIEEKTQTEEKESTTTDAKYTGLAQVVAGADYQVTATYLLPEQDKKNPVGRKLYVRIQNYSDDDKFKLDIDKTTYVINDKETIYYKSIRADLRDESWYNKYTAFVDKDGDYIEGYVRLPKKIDSDDKVTVNLYLTRRSAQAESIPVTFNIDMSQISGWEPDEEEDD